MTLTITDSTGKITYKKVYYGDENVGKLAENIQLKAGDKITFSTKEGMKIDSVADLVGKQKYTFTFLVTPNLHLIRADENTKPIIIVPKKVIDLEAGTNFDPLASVTAQNGDGSQIKLTADNISSDINLNRGGFYHVIYHVIDKNGNVATERVTVQVTEPLTVHFVNADGTPVIENNSLIPEVKINGLAGQIVPVKYTIPNGWVIEKGQEIPTKYELHLNHNDIFIKIKHQIMNISTIDPKATKTIYRKIIFNFPDGKNKEITQNATFHRTVIKDLVTGILSYDNWNEESVKLPEVPVPNIAGYKANISKIGAESINATDSNKLINVNYIALLIENKNDEQEIKVTPLVKHAEVEKYDKNSADNSNTRVQNIDVDTRNKIRVNSVKSQSLQIYENKEIISAKNSNTMHKDSYKSLSIQKNAMINDRADKSKRDAHHNKVNNINSKLPQTGNKQNDESISIIGFIISSFTLLGWSKYWEKLIKKIEK